MSVSNIDNIDDVIGAFTKLIKEAAQTQLGITALIIIALAVLIFFLFNKSSDGFKLGALALIVGVVIFILAMFYSNTKNDTEENFKEKISKICENKNNEVIDIISKRIVLEEGKPIKSINGKVIIIAEYKNDDSCTINIKSSYDPTENKRLKIDQYNNSNIKINNCKYIISMTETVNPTTCNIQLIPDNG